MSLLFVSCISCISYVGQETTGLAVEDQVTQYQACTHRLVIGCVLKPVRVCSLSKQSSPSINGAWCPVTQSFRSKGSKPRFAGSTDPRHPGSCSA